MYTYLPEATVPSLPLVLSATQNTHTTEIHPQPLDVSLPVHAIDTGPQRGRMHGQGRGRTEKGKGREHDLLRETVQIAPLPPCGLVDTPSSPHRSQPLRS